MNIIKHIGIGIVSVLQTIFGIFVVLVFTGQQKSSAGVVIFSLIVLLGLAMLSCWIRGISDMGLWLGLPELLLSPISLFRFFIGTIAAFASISRDNIQFDYDEDCFDPPYVLQKISKFVFYFYYDGYCYITKFRNIVTQILVCIPVSALLSFCAIKAFDAFFNQANIFTAFLYGTCVTLLSGLLCSIRGQESSVVYYHGDYKFKNRYTDETVSRYQSDSNVRLNLSQEAKDAGWETTCDGYGSYFTGWMIATIIFAPVLAFTQTIGLIFAFLASPNTCFCSSYTKLDYEEFRLPFLQRILHFFFNFVFW